MSDNSLIKFISFGTITTTTETTTTGDIVPLGGCSTTASSTS